MAIALQDDERGRQAEASKMYSCAIELAIQAVSSGATKNHVISIQLRIKLHNCVCRSFLQLSACTV